MTGERQCNQFHRADVLSTRQHIFENRKLECCADYKADKVIRHLSRKELKKGEDQNQYIPDYNFQTQVPNVKLLKPFLVVQ